MDVTEGLSEIGGLKNDWQKRSGRPMALLIFHKQWEKDRSHCSKMRLNQLTYAARSIHLHCVQYLIVTLRNSTSADAVIGRGDASEPVMTDNPRDESIREPWLDGTVL